MKNAIHLSAILLLFSIYSNVNYSQTFVPGQTYFDSTGYVEYRAGNLPIILSAPHGGNWSPDSIPDRDCSGCSYGMDSYTRIITWGIYDAFFEQTGCYPHMIMNRLHRSKFDANRDIGDAADGNPLVEQAWYGYHRFIDSAKGQVTEDYGRGIFLDIHGHAHPNQRIELGYLLNKTKLQFSDSTLNSITYNQQSSIRTLVTDNIQSISHSQLLRGSQSFGTLLANKGFPSVPSSSDAYPIGAEDYFAGGYNTVRHGSRDNLGEIDAIQIELNQDVRFDDSTRLILIDSLTSAAIEYFNYHYNALFIGNFCDIISGISSNEHVQFDLKLFPNPAVRSFVLQCDYENVEIMIYNSMGQEILSKGFSYQENISISSLPSGYYFVHLKKDGIILGKGKIIKI